MKWLGKMLIAGLIAGSLVLALFLWVKIVKPGLEHHARIQKATSLIASYGQKEWNELYEECLLLYDPKTAWNKNDGVWPKRVSEINPYDVYLRDDIVHMYWTGGFDEFALSLEIYRDHLDTPRGGEGPGILLIDSRKEGMFSRPYVPAVRATCGGVK